MAFVLLTCALSCASVDVNRVGGGWCETDGFRYYLPHPYLLVTETVAKPGDSILFEKVSETISSTKPISAVRIKTDSIENEMIRLDVSPASAGYFAKKDGTQLDQMEVNGQKIPGAYKWKAEQNSLLFKVLTIDQVLNGTPATLKFTAKGITNTGLRGSTKAEMKKITSKADEASFSVQPNKGPVKAGLKMSIVYLPDKSQTMAVEPTAGLGTVSTTLTLKDGWMLTNVSSSADSKVPETLEGVASIISSVSQLAPVIGLFSAEEDPKVEMKPLTPGLYAFVFDDKSGYFTGFKPLTHSQ
ncbi:MAG: hypothetical protein DWP92_01685 [Armatimonadetes bacterium]|nr:MAG: hypothetical protein DWP92_01685 [Armatimonadota bacterium]